VWKPHTLKFCDVAQQLVPSVLNMAALSTWPVPRRLYELVVSATDLNVPAQCSPTFGQRKLDHQVSAVV
jgi:hypothetical protein